MRLATPIGVASDQHPLTSRQVITYHSRCSALMEGERIGLSSNSTENHLENTMLGATIGNSKKWPPRLYSRARRRTIWRFGETQMRLMIRNTLWLP